MKNCLNCKKEFKPFPASKGLYCSRSCSDAHRIPWNKGKKIDFNKYPNFGHIGHTHTLETRKAISITKKSDPAIREENSWQWKGDNVGYRALHDWVVRQLGKANKCMINLNHRSTRYHWANISKEYKRDLNDWMQMCPSCNLKDRIGRRVSP